MAIMTLVVPGLFSTIALPAYAFDATPAGTAQGTAPRAPGGTQTVVVSAAAQPVVSRDGYSATTVAQLQQTKIAQQTAAVNAQRAAQRAQIKASFAYSGPTATQLLATAKPSSIDLNAVVNFALSFQGVRYQYGGATPAGFDCSGFVMYVYAKFGVALPHSATGQGRAGVVIPRSQARPGDLVVLNDGSHDGFYMGGNNILDSPQPGGVVSVRPLWTSAVYFVRVG